MSQEMLNCVLKDYTKHVETIKKSNINMIKEYVKSLVKSTIDEFLLSLIHSDLNNRYLSSWDTIGFISKLRNEEDPFEKYEANIIQVWSSLISIKEFTTLLYDLRGTELKGKYCQLQPFFSNRFT